MATRSNPPSSTVTPFPKSGAYEQLRRQAWRLSFGSVLVGSIIVLGIQTLFGLLGAAIGLTTIELEESLPGWGTLIFYGIFGLVSLIVSFGLGGFVAARLDGVQDRFSAVVHGIAAWALVTLALVLLSARLITVFGGFFTAAGIGAGSAITASSVLQEITSLKPRIVTDLQIFKGKAVTTLETTPPQEVRPEAVVSQAKKDVEKLAEKPEVREDVEKIGAVTRKTAAGASWIIFLSLLTGLLASGGGALRGRV